MRQLFAAYDFAAAIANAEPGFEPGREPGLAAEPVAPAAAAAVGAERHVPGEPCDQQVDSR